MEDSDSEELGFDPTQTEKDIFTNIREKDGHLGNKEFRETLAACYSETDLYEFRKSLFDYAVVEVEYTPRAPLIIRKDTQNSGGLALNEKLADDIYNLYHYIEGDKSFDIYKLFSEKDKLRLKRQESGNMHIRNKQAEEKEMSLNQFCTLMLTEMRKDRDTYLSDICDIKKDMSTIMELKMEVGNLKSTLAKLTDHVN